MSKSKIEWTEETWNPIVGCSILSPGCTHCYAMKMAARIEAMNAQARAAGKPPGAPQYDGTTRIANGNAVWTGKLALAGDNVLLAPLKRKKPTTYFVNSMGDLFHEDVPDEWIDRVFAVMALTPRHTYQVLTKRAARMRDFVTRLHQAVTKYQASEDGVALDGPCLVDQFSHVARSLRDPRAERRLWPLPNIWLGVSAERQKEADERIYDLLRAPAAVRFISAEPLLGPIDLRALKLEGCTSRFDALKHGATYSLQPDGKRFYHIGNQPVLDWVIVGGESGPDARPMHIGWARDLRDQCAAAGVPFFFKQHGEWHPRGNKQGIADHCIAIDGTISRGDEQRGGPAVRPRWIAIERIGKKSAGRLLDGVIHDALPTDRRLTPANPQVPA